MAKKRIRSRPGLWGMTYHYDEDGNFLGKSRPSLLGNGTVHTDRKGNYAGYTRPGFLAEEVHYDAKNKRHVTSYPGLIGEYHTAGGRPVGKSVPGFFDTQYTEYDDVEELYEAVYDDGESDAGEETAKPGAIWAAVVFLLACFIAVAVAVASSL